MAESLEYQAGRLQIREDTIREELYSENVYETIEDEIDDFDSDDEEMKLLDTNPTWVDNRVFFIPNSLKQIKRIKRKQLKESSRLMKFLEVSVGMAQRPFATDIACGQHNDEFNIIKTLESEVKGKLAYTMIMAHMSKSKKLMIKDLRESTQVEDLLLFLSDCRLVDAANCFKTKKQLYKTMILKKLERKVTCIKCDYKEKKSDIYENYHEELHQYALKTEIIKLTSRYEGKDSLSEEQSISVLVLDWINELRYTTDLTRALNRCIYKKYITISKDGKLLLMRNISGLNKSALTKLCVFVIKNHHSMSVNSIMSRQITMDNCNSDMILREAIGSINGKSAKDTKYLENEFNIRKFVTNISKNILECMGFEMNCEIAVNYMNPNLAYSRMLVRSSDPDIAAYINTYLNYDY